MTSPPNTMGAGAWGEDDEIVWTDATGRDYRMADISDRHMRNIVALLERQADAADGCVFMGEYAQDAAESAAERYRDLADEFRGELAARAALSLPNPSGDRT